ncbi:hypothetical protein CFP56_013311 [Quercus suber]|uniref:Uncharacterized protein n=1 Tax=Quercus suber TaxID=58331 RepID=A0AAW0KVK7_QUESU
MAACEILIPIAFTCELRTLGDAPKCMAASHVSLNVHEQNDSVAVVACGLGGGSLVNAGVTVPTPVRARRNPKWPKEWERDWDICEASAAAMRDKT